LQIDSTQDVGVVDQAAVCIRYIYEREVKERLFALLNVVDSSRNGYYNMLKQLFSEHSIKFNNIIGESFDGAANKRGECLKIIIHIDYYELYYNFYEEIFYIGGGDMKIY